MTKRFMIGFLLSLVFVTGYCQPKVIAHRGFWNIENSAQNSIASLYNAYQYGCYGTEFDVLMTNDSVLVLHHDDLTKSGNRIENSPYAAIQNERLENGEILPTLEQFFVHAKNCPEIKLIFEIKPHTGAERESAVAESAVKMVKQFNLQDRVEYISFSKHLCVELKRLSPATSVSYLGDNISPKELKNLGLNIDRHYSPFLRDNTAEEAKKLGLMTNVWTVNDAETMRKLIEQKVDYITTDKPLLLKSVIKELR